MFAQKARKVKRFCVLFLFDKIRSRLQLHFLRKM